MIAPHPSKELEIVALLQQCLFFSRILPNVKFWLLLLCDQNKAFINRG
jgi:hypothetical protein